MSRGDCLMRMFDAYGKSVTPQRMYYYEQWAKDLELEEVSRVIDSVVKSEPYLPTVNKLYELSQLGQARESMQKNVYFCEKCNVGFTVISGICPTCGEQGL